MFKKIIEKCAIFFICLMIFSFGSLIMIGGFGLALKPLDAEIAVVKLYGPISTSTVSGYLNTSSGVGADQVMKIFKKFKEYKNLKGLILRINSPGGTVAASQEIFEEVKKLREQGLKVVVSVADIMASGAYYAALPADKILANRGSIIGSIGVIAEFPVFKELFEKTGVRFEVIKSGKFKDIGNLGRDMTEEERKILQEMVQSGYHQFKADVSQSRNISMDKLTELAQGQVFNGEQALSLGLIDGLGNYNDAIDEIKVLCKLSDKPKLIEFGNVPGILSDVLNLYEGILLNHSKLWSMSVK